MHGILDPWPAAVEASLEDIRQEENKTQANHNAHDDRVSASPSLDHREEVVDPRHSIFKASMRTRI
jgi:hypothetical protein